MENEEDKPLRKKRHKREKRKSRRVLQNLNFPEPPANLLENYHDLDLSVEFLSQVFKYVDELCEYINNGDQNLDRSSVVIQNLNYAVSCYRVNLTEPKPEDPIQEDFQEDQEDFKYEIDPPEVDFPSNDEEDEEYKEPKPKKKKVKKKTERNKSEIKEETNGNDDTFQDGTKYLGFFSSCSLKMRENYISFAQLFLLSLYSFCRKCVLLFNFIIQKLKSKHTSLKKYTS